MNRFTCLDGGETHQVFGVGGADCLAADFEELDLVRLPDYPSIGKQTVEEEIRVVGLPVVWRVG